MTPDLLTEALRAGAALVFVLALMGLVAMVARRFAPGGAGLGSLVPRQRRLSIVETLPLDHRRRLVLIRRDGTEHLVILGPSGETLIESQIAAREPAASESD